MNINRFFKIIFAGFKALHPSKWRHSDAMDADDALASNSASLRKISVFCQCRSNPSTWLSCVERSEHQKILSYRAEAKRCSGRGLYGWVQPDDFDLDSCFYQLLHSTR